MKALPIGIQTFNTLIEQNYLYVDKTQLIYRLVTGGQVYFLSRPRRFGKSLLISTLAALFEGRRELFKGLWIDESDYIWAPHPVIQIDFSLFPVKNAEELKSVLTNRLQEIARTYGITLAEGTYYLQFAALIRQLAEQGKVVVLIDEYDKPIIDNIEEVATAQEIRDILKGFYTVLKGMDAYLRFVLLTGVTRFSKVGIFSGLNQLEDITMSSHYSALLGITEGEIQPYFGAYLEDFARQTGTPMAQLREQIREWYDGFCFAAQCQSVYNPFSLLMLCKQQRFSIYWFETGTPTFLLKLIKNQHYDVRELEKLQVNELAFSSYEVDNLAIVPLLFQTGYLTIKEYDPARRLYRLYYPNAEVEDSFLRYLVGAFSAVRKEMSDTYVWHLFGALAAPDWQQFFTVLGVFFADIPYDIQMPQERYYQTVFYLIFKLMGLQVGAEVRTNRGRIDAVIEMTDKVFIFEFKLHESAEVALAQIKTRGYAETYRLQRKAIYLVGVAFDSAQRRVAEWLVETIQEEQGCAS